MLRGCCFEISKICFSNELTRPDIVPAEREGGWQSCDWVIQLITPLSSPSASWTIRKFTFKQWGNTTDIFSTLKAKNVIYTQYHDVIVYMFSTQIITFSR